MLRAQQAANGYSCNGSCLYSVGSAVAAAGAGTHAGNSCLRSGERHSAADAKLGTAQAFPTRTLFIITNFRPFAS